MALITFKILCGVWWVVHDVCLNYAYATVMLKQPLESVADFSKGLSYLVLIWRLVQSGLK